MNKKLFVAVLCVCSLMSCTKDSQLSIRNNKQSVVTLKAYFEDDEAYTKTTRQSDGSTWWSDGDQISLFFGEGVSGGNCFTTGKGGETASFTGTLSAFTAGGEGYTGETTYFWGVYPYKGTTSCDNASVTVNVPSVQPGVAGTFAPGVNISVGRSENLKMGFYNVCSGFSFSVSAEGMTELVFKSGDDTPVVGDAKVEFVTGVPTVTDLTNTSTEVHIIPEEGEFEVGKKYYLEFIPVTMNGFTVTLYNAKGQEASYEYTSSRTFKRGMFTSVSNVDMRVGEWKTRQGNISFADANFKAYCVNYVDTDKDSEISYVEASTVTALALKGSSISSLNELQYFQALETLSCEDNLITTLDVSHNSALKILTCSNNQLTSLDVTKNTALEYLTCSNNQLTSLDVTKNTALGYLNCASNQIKSLDVTQNKALAGLNCVSNQIENLDLSQNEKLTNLMCDYNKLSSIDVSHNPALTTMQCNNNQLTSLSFTNNAKLTDLYCTHNQLTSLDVTMNPDLKNLNCSSNQLTSLDVTVNTALTGLYCSGNQLTGLDVTKNAALSILFCQDNQLSALDVSKNTSMTVLFCSYNQLTTLNVSKNTALTDLFCSPMNDANGNNLLQTLYIYNGQQLSGITSDRSTERIPAETVIADANPGTGEGTGEEELDDTSEFGSSIESYTEEDF